MFAIAGALEDVHWNELPADYKEQLREQLKEHQMSAHSRRD
tara:strand:- start:433 stop:555 length:123 start_codon:yes stop_codon:yes gene_type:complete